MPFPPVPGSQDETEELRLRLEEAEQTLRAIRSGEVDSLIVEGPDGPRVYALEGARDSYRVLVEAMNEGAATLTGVGTIAYCNGRFAELLDLPLEKVIGGRMSEHVPGDQLDTLDALLRVAWRGSSRGDLDLRRRDGALVRVHLSLSTVTDEPPVLCAVATDLTEQIRTQQLRDSEERAVRRAAEFEALLNAVPAAVFIARDRDATRIDGNGVAYDLLRLPRGAEVSKTASLPPGNFRVMSGGVELTPGGLPVQIAAAQGKEIRACELELAFDDGTVRHILGNATPLFDDRGRPSGAIGAFIDITDRRRTERNREFLARATHELASARDPAAALARLAELVVPQIADLCGVDLAQESGASGEFVGTASVDPVKGHAFRESRRLFPIRPGPSSSQVESLRRGEPVFFPEVGERELAAIGRSPEHLELVRSVGLRSFIGAPLQSRGVRYGAVLLALTEPGRRFDRIDLELAIELARRTELAIDNARLFADLERAVRARDDILGVVSHDLKNPLTAIQVSAAAAARSLQKGPEARLERHLENIQRATRRAHRLLEDLRDMASIRAGRMSVHLSKEDAQTLAGEAVQAHEAAARERGVSLSSEGAPGTAVRCDRDRVLQVFTNAISNAIRFCAAGARIDLSFVPGEQFVTFAVRDTGAGIADDALPHVFDAYWSTAQRAREGTGLGLFISKGIVEAHGGRMWIESRLGHGTTVRFTIPAATALQAEASS